MPNSSPEEVIALNVLVWAQGARHFTETLHAVPLPAGITLAVVETEEEALPHAPETDMLVTWGMNDIARFRQHAPRLRFVQALSSGVEGILTPEFVASPLLLANARGANAPAIVEHALALIFALTRKIHVAVRNQEQHRWQFGPAAGSEIAGQTLGVLGMGAIGRETARRARLLGMKIAAVQRPGREPLPEVDQYVADTKALCAVADFLLVAVPLTPENTSLVGAPELACMKPTAHLVNVARGPVVDEAALIAAIQEGRLAGAGLDVTAVEPLPPESPLWDLENVIITPHTGGASPHTMGRVLELTFENIRRLYEGAELLNLVDKQRGY